jgi:4-hydroxy-3-polyprenylbenzoate decarboxylase
MKALSNFVSQLEQNGELLRISTFVDPAFEMAEIVDRCSKNPAHNKALLFENNGTPFPVLMNMMGSERRMCMALGVKDLDDVSKRIDTFFAQLTQPKISLWDKLKLLPALRQAARWLPVHTQNADCQQVKLAVPDLNCLPITTSWAFDGGKFITLPMVHTADFQTGVRNVGMYRMQIFDGQTTGMHWHVHKTGARHYAQYKAANCRMPVVVTIGGDPIYTYCATAPLPDNVDEYLLAGFLRNRPVRLVRCITQPLCVPADVDFVVEGYVDPQEPLVTEGPFGDHTGFYSLPDLYPRLHVTAVTHRKNAIYPATLVGIPPQEDACITKATERIFLSPIRLAMLPEVVDMSMPDAGVAHNIAIVKIRKTYAGQAKKVANALWGAGQMMLNKILIIVNENVDVQNITGIVKLAEQRFNPATDVYFGKGPLDVLDHAAQQYGYGGKMCIDLTSDQVSSTKYQGPSTNALFAFVHSGENAVTARVVVRFDEAVDVQDLHTCIWLLGNNIDPERDCKIVNGQLLIDATLNAAKMQRPVPNVVCTSDEIIRRVDSKWETLGIGSFVPSPSKLRAALNPNAAAERI